MQSWLKKYFKSESEGEFFKFYHRWIFYLSTENSYLFFFALTIWGSMGAVLKQGRGSLLINWISRSLGIDLIRKRVGSYSVIITYLEE